MSNTDDDVPDTSTDALTPSKSGRSLLPRKPGPWIAAAVIIGVPAILTIIGAVTAPPLSPVPTGHIVYLEADQPSEKTTMLHDMFSVGSDQRERLVTAENEPQDVDAGAREWIIEPVGSPDGTRVAYVKEQIVLIEEKQSVDNQIWVADVTSPKPTAGKLVYDLTANKLPQITRLVWTPDGQYLAFVEGKTLYEVPVNPSPTAKPRIGQLDLPDEAAVRKPKVSPLALISLSDTGDVTCFAHGFGRVYQTLEPAWDLPKANDPVVKAVTPRPVASTGRADSEPRARSPVDQLNFEAYAASLSPSGDRLAAVEDDSHVIQIMTSTSKTLYPVQLGWSVFGHRKITSLRWSPDGRYVGYTASKPPAADNEMFYLDTQTGKYFKLPFRCGPASWDWTK